ncbi:MAG TPA: hypothetical protein VJT31_24875 [Rugosimonospora sp.]|nr:hypothetical protein [Rugosimonospora sp.]
MSDEVIYDLVRSTLADVAAEARPVDLVPTAVRRVRRRALALSIGAVAAAAALLIGLPLATVLAGGAGTGDRHSTPAATRQPATSPPGLVPSRPR